jgi:hypothetical protein
LVGRGIDAGRVDLLAVTQNAGNLDGGAVDDPNDLDFG